MAAEIAILVPFILQKFAFSTHYGGELGSLAAQHRESQIARFPESRAWDRSEFPQREAKKLVELQESRIAENRFRIAIRIASYP